MRGRRRILLLSTFLLCGLLLGPLSISGIAAQRPFTEWTDTEREAFLLNAEIVNREDIGIGITGSERVTLDDGNFRHDAQIQTVYEQEAIKRFEDGRTELNFTDFYTYNIAGYRLDRLIGLNMVPVHVPRRVGRRDAALSWWVDDVQMMEIERYQRAISPPRPLEWTAQVGDANVFHELIYNTDPNLTNLLITNDWQIRLIDFGRAFRTRTELRMPENLPLSIRRQLYQGLMSLDEAVLQETMEDLLTGAQIDAILARRDLIINHFDSLIEERGEGLVLR